MKRKLNRLTELIYEQWEVGYVLTPEFDSTGEHSCFTPIG